MNLKEEKFSLVGFMATGKTTIGKKLGSKLNIPFFDSDKEKIEHYSNLSIGNIFKHKGEAAFRKWKRKLLHIKLITIKNGFVMSLGGGFYINNNVRKLIYSSGISIWLDASIDIINNRIKNSKNERPFNFKI